MAFEITGKLYKKMDAETKGASFNVREFVIEIISKGDNHIKSKKK